MGGVRTNHTGESPTLKGLFAAGEAACWDMHGFNRLGGNSVAETVVAGMIVGEYIADFCDRQRERGRHPDEARPRHPAARAGEARRAHRRARHRGRLGDQGADAGLMTAKVGIFRRGEDLQAAVEELQQLLVRSRNIGLSDRSRGANPELVTAYRVQKMLKVALCIAYGH
jgi:fumarate reductase flavoprotein subunit